MWGIDIVRKNRFSATVCWDAITCDNIMIILRNLTTVTDLTINTPADKRLLTLPFSLKPGHKYQVEVWAQSMTAEDGLAIYRTIRQANMTFRAVFTKAEMSMLLNKALNYINRTPNKFLVSRWFYRNKTHEYFDQIFSIGGGIMRTYLKDHNGDPASIINDTLPGLFFGVNVEKSTLHPPTWSNFGPRRLYVPAGNLMFPDSTRLYFADFYCNKDAHYVTLVLTNQGSLADKFCQENLISVLTNDNPFLYKVITPYGSEVMVTTNVWLEVLYTEDMDLNWWITNRGCKLDTVPSKGTSRPGGLPKNEMCTICNLD